MVAFTAGEWEGKGLKYFILDTIKHRPVMAFAGLFYMVIVPAATVGLHMLYEHNTVPFTRFANNYIVCRDDDPKVARILRYDENGNIVQLQPRKH